MILNMVVNNSSLKWKIHKGNMDGILLCSWLKVIYESVSKLDPLMHFYGDKILPINLNAGGLLVEYIDQIHGFEILWREIDKTV